ncbi:MAG TPA: fasciclin domain-containing protein, partial [Brevundimonas sp.]
MTTYRTATLAAVSSFALLALAACGQNDARKEPAPIEAPAPSTAPATTEPMVGGVAMNPSDNLVANASKAPNLTTLVSALQAAGLTERLQGPGPFTVFAPDNAAFEKIPAATREGWMQPAQKAALTKVLTYHVVPGRLTAADLAAQAQANGGTATLTTVQGEKLTAKDAG